MIERHYWGDVGPWAPTGDLPLPTPPPRLLLGLSGVPCSSSLDTLLRDATSPGVLLLATRLPCADFHSPPRKGDAEGWSSKGARDEADLHCRLLEEGARGGEGGSAHRGGGLGRGRP